MQSQITSILKLLALAERLKFELRHSWLSSGRRESVAEHTWQMALMAILVNPHLEQPANLEHTLKMIIIHDLVEAEAGDIPFFEIGDRKAQKAAKEEQAIKNIREMLGPPLGQEFYDLFHEFEAVETPEAKLAKALDNLEVQIQHNLADFSSWEPIEYGLAYNKIDPFTAYDPFLDALCQQVKSDAESKMIENGVDVEQVKNNL